MKTDTTDKGKAVLSKIGFILVAAGAAVGIGNIWRFPYLVAQHGGGTFIFTYLFFALFIGLSVMLSEFVIGRYLGNPVLDNMKGKLKHSNIFSKTIYLNLVIVLVLISFYFVVSGWTFYYSFNSILGVFNLGGIEYNANSTEYYQAIFGGLLSNPLMLILFSVLVTITTIIVNLKGLTSGVEKVNFIFLPLLFVLLIVLIVKILSLDNATGGLEYIFTFDIERLPSAIIPALGQALFSLSVGLGTMIIFSSHTNKDYNLTSSATSTVILGSAIGIFASILIIPAVVSFGYDMSSGPGLTFLTLPKVFSHIQFGGVFASIFFLIIAMAAFTSTIAIIETGIPYIVKLFNTTRKKAILILGGYAFISNIIMCLALNVWSGFTIFGLDLFSLVSGPILDNILIIGVLLIILMIAIGITKENVKKELTNNGTIAFKFFNLWLYVTIFVTPIVVLATVLYSIFG